MIYQMFIVNLTCLFTLKSCSFIEVPFDLTPLCYLNWNDSPTSVVWLVRWTSDLKVGVSIPNRREIYRGIPIGGRTLLTSTPYTTFFPPPRIIILSEQSQKPKFRSRTFLWPLVISSFGNTSSSKKYFEPKGSKHVGKRANVRKVRSYAPK
jgi:hypothetical protein